MNSTFDVIIAGGGPNGMSLALGLGLRPGLRILLVDAGDPRAHATHGHDTRGSALTRATQHMLAALGVLAPLSDHLMEMRDIVVTDGGGAQGGSAVDGRPTLLAFTTETDKAAAAAIVENRHLTAALLAAVEDTPSITLWTSATITAVKQSAAFAMITLADGRVAKAPLLVGADGRNSTIRQSASIAVEVHDHRQSALTFTIAHTLPHGGRAEEHFSPHGVLAILPLPGHRSSIVWAEAPSEAARLQALPSVEFATALKARIGPHLGEMTVEGRVNLHPLKLQIARAMTASRIALVGDAAHVIHPLAGLGLNLGFKDVAALVECVVDAMARGEDHGAPQVLERYERWRRFDVVSTVLAMEGMNHLFANDDPLLAMLRKAGLAMVDRLPQVKATIMREASGTTGALPRLMRGLR